MKNLVYPTTSFTGYTPITYPWQSAYATFNNNPVFYSDPSGLEGVPPTTRTSVTPS